MESKRIHYLLSISLFVISLTFVMDGCSKKPIEKSYWSENGQSLPSYTGNDKKTGLEWTVANDSKYLFLSLETSNPQVERMIMFRGLTLYIDPSGKKNKDTYLRYPYMKDPRNLFREMRSQNDGESRGRSFQSPVTAYWKHGDDDMILNSAMQHSKFRYHITMDSLGFMEYQVRIPLNRIADAGYKSLTEPISIGIVVQHPESGSDFRARFRPEGGFADGDGDRGGDRDGGGGRRRPEGGDRDRSSRFQPVNVKIWFLTQLAQP